MELQLSKAEAQRLGIIPGSATAGTRKKPGRYHTRCVDCSKEFQSRIAEDRHMSEEPHRRFELVL